MDSERKQVVATLVDGFFAGRLPTVRIDSVHRAEVFEVIIDLLHEHGRFPLHADRIDGDPPMYVGEQVRRLDDGNYLVANVDFYAHASPGSGSTRVFQDAHDAVACFVRSQISDRMHGVPVL